MSWDRATCAKALAAAIDDAAIALGDNVSVFDKPPSTVNPPAIVVSRPVEVQYSMAAFGVDEASLPVVCVGPLDGDDRVAELIALVRVAISDRTLGGAVQVCYPSVERNWRQQNIAGADVLTAEVYFTIQM